MPPSTAPSPTRRSGSSSTRLWAEAIPTLPQDAGLDTAAYTAELAERFANTALAHRTAQIANDGSQKLPQRIVASALERIEAGAASEHLTLVVAAWIAACEARGKTLPEGHFTDPLDAALTALLASSCRRTRRVAAVFDLAGFARDHAERQTLIELVAAHLVHLRRDGPHGALRSAYKATVLPEQPAATSIVPFEFDTHSFADQFRNKMPAVKDCYRQARIWPSGTSNTRVLSAIELSHKV